MPAARSWCRFYGLVILAGLLGAGAASAEPPAERDSDYLDQIRRTNQVLAQRMEAEVRAAIREAQPLLQTDPARAVERLKKALATLQDDSALTESRRDTLIRMLKDRIRVAEAAPEKNADSSERRIEFAGRRAEEERRKSEQERIKRSLDTIYNLQRDGRTDEAKRQADELTRRYGDNPALQGAGRTLSGADQEATRQRLRNERERRLASVSRDVSNSALPPVGDVDFGNPEEWRRKTELRQKSQFHLTPKEKSIVQALNSPISASFKDGRFEDVIEYIATTTGQPILLDKKALEESDVNYDTPISVHVKGIAVRTLLRKVLGEFGLTYVVKDQVIHVTTVLKAKEMMIVRSYPIGDLVSNTGALGGTIGLRLGPLVNQLQMTQNANQIIDMIQTSVDPQSWQANGGPGMIAFNPATMTLVIKQSAEVHAMLGASLMP